MIVNGARIGFFQGDIRLLSDDLLTLKPTVFPVVPRLLNRMYDKVGAHTAATLSLAAQVDLGSKLNTPAPFCTQTIKADDDTVPKDKGVCVYMCV